MNDLAFRTKPVSGAVELFGWLSALFAASPNLEAIAAHRRGAASAWMRRLAAEPALAPGLRKMRRVLDGDADDKEIQAKIERRYLLLFEGVGGPRTAPPYESVFTPGAEWRLFQEPTAEMEALLAECDLSVSDDFALPADHLAVELALAAHLAARHDPRAYAMVDRLTRWAPRFAAAVAAVDEDGFWAGAADVVAAALRHGQDAFDTPQKETEEANA